MHWFRGERRGREMASVQIDDKGRMAGIAASVEKGPRGVG